MPPDLSHIEGNRVSEYNEDEADRGNDAERRRVKRDLDKTEPGRAENRSESEKHRHLWQARPVGEAREERGHYDDDADKRQQSLLDTHIRNALRIVERSK